MDMRHPKGHDSIKNVFATRWKKRMSIHDEKFGDNILYLRRAKNPKATFAHGTSPICTYQVSTEIKQKAEKSTKFSLQN